MLRSIYKRYEKPKKTVTPFGKVIYSQNDVWDLRQARTDPTLTPTSTYPHVPSVMYVQPYPSLQDWAQLGEGDKQANNDYWKSLPESIKNKPLPEARIEWSGVKSLKMMAIKDPCTVYPCIIT